MSDQETDYGHFLQNCSDEQSLVYISLIHTERELSSLLITISKRSRVIFFNKGDLSAKILAVCI
jgi:hypothetical protein